LAQRDLIALLPLDHERVVAQQGLPVKEAT
jgi:hypothetical protein